MRGYNATATINGTEYKPTSFQGSIDAENSRTMVLDLSLDYASYEPDDHFPGAEVVLEIEIDGTTTTRFRGFIENVREDVSSNNKTLNLTCIDKGHVMVRNQADVDIKSDTEMEEKLRLEFVDDDLSQPREALIRQDVGVPETLDRDIYPPPVQVWREKSGEHNRPYNQDAFQLLTLSKKITFADYQLDENGDPLPTNSGITGAGSIPNSQDWEYYTHLEVYELIDSQDDNGNPIIPVRNDMPETPENVLRDVLTRPVSDNGGGAGLESSDLYYEAALNQPFDASADVVSIPDRLDDDDDGSTTDTIACSELTVRDEDLEHIDLDSTIFLELGDIDEDSETDRARFWVRGITDSQTILVYPQIPSDMTSGTPIYVDTLQYTGLQIKRYNWEQRDGTIDQMLDDWYDKRILPTNYLIHWDHEQNHLVGKEYQQKTIKLDNSGVGTTMSITSGTISQAKPGEQISDGTQYTTIVTVDYTANEITVSDTIDWSSGDVFHVGTNILGDWNGSEWVGDRRLSGTTPQSLNSMQYRVTVDGAGSPEPFINSQDFTQGGVVNSDPQYWKHVPLGLSNEFEEGSIEGALSTSVDRGYALYRDHIADGSEDSYVNQNVITLDLGEEKQIHTIKLHMGQTEETKARFNEGHHSGQMQVMVAPDRTNESSFDPTDGSNDFGFRPASDNAVSFQWQNRPDAGENNVLLAEVKRARKTVRFIRIKCVLNARFMGISSPSRIDGIAIVNIQAVGNPDIHYSAEDQEAFEDEGFEDFFDTDGDTNPNPDAHPLLEEDTKPFVSLTKKGGEIAELDPDNDNPNEVRLTDSNNTFEVDDLVYTYDGSNFQPNKITAVDNSGSDTKLEFDVGNFGSNYSVGDEVGSRHRWMPDVNGNLLDFYRPDIIDTTFDGIRPTQLITEQSYIEDSLDGTKLAADRLNESLKSYIESRADWALRTTLNIGDIVYINEQPSLVLRFQYTDQGEVTTAINFNSDITQ